MSWLVIISVVVAVGGVRFLPSLHPAQVWSVVWGLCIVAFSLHLLPYAPLNTATILILAGSNVGFLAATLVGERVASAGWQRVPRPDRRTLEVAAALALALTIVGVMAFIVQASLAYGFGSVLRSSSVIRSAVGLGEFKTTQKYLVAASAAAALCGVRAGLGGATRRWAGSAIVAVGSTYFITGRSSLIFAALVGLGAYAISRPQGIPKRWLVLTTGTTLVLAGVIFVILGSAVGKTFSSSEFATFPNGFQQHAALREFAMPYEYATAPIAALGLEVRTDHTLPRAAGCATFAFACSILKHLGAAATPYPTERPFTPGPLSWNTYTGLEDPLLDAGGAAVVPAVLLLGLVVGGIWAGVRRRSVVAFLAYGLLFPAIAFSPNQNYFTQTHLIGALATVTVALVVARIAFRLRPIHLRRKGLPAAQLEDAE